MTDMSDNKPNNKYDIAIINGNVIDVVNECIKTANIGISGDKIAVVTERQISAHTVIDAKNLMFHRLHRFSFPCGRKCLFRPMPSCRAVRLPWAEKEISTLKILN